MSVQYYVIDSMEEWLAMECSCVQTVILQQPKIPRFDFNIKTLVSTRGKDFFIPGCAISGLKEIRNFIKLNNISYRPSNLIKFAFEYIESMHCFKQSDAPKQKHMYPQPLDIHVAQAVATQLFHIEDILGTEDEDLLVYYYLSVLKAVNHPLINQAYCLITQDSDDLFNSALIPNCDRKYPKIQYYFWYIDLIYFLSLIAPPICFGDTVVQTTSKVRIRHEEQMKILCRSVGITNYEQIVRGAGWQKLTKFLETIPTICRIIARSIMKPEILQISLTVIENQVILQLKELWKWVGLYNFHDCYIFAISEDTEAHQIPVIANQTEQIKCLYAKLKDVVGEDHLIPYAKLLVDDDKLFEQYEEKNYPDLFYATKSKMVLQKTANTNWEEFVATRSVNIPRQEIDEKLQIPMKDKNRELDKPETKCFNSIEEDFIFKIGTTKQEETEVVENVFCEKLESYFFKLFESDTESEFDFSSNHGLKEFEVR